MEDRNYPVTRTCPHCGNTGAKLMPPIDDFSEYSCPHCGRYRIWTMEKLIEIRKADPTSAHFVEQNGHKWLVE